MSNVKKGVRLKAGKFSQLHENCYAISDGDRAGDPIHNGMRCGILKVHLEEV